jgi:dipeptidyl-peptidase III
MEALMRRGPAALLFAAAACAAGPRPRPEAGPGAQEPIVGMVGDVAVAAMEPEGFDALSREERLLAWHLSQAAMASHPVVLMQNYRHDLAIWELVEALYARRSALDPVFGASLADYRRRLFLHKGVHDAYTEEKFVPDFGQAEFEAELQKAVAAGLALPPGTDLAVLAPAMFDPAVDRFRVAKTPGPAGDPVRASSVNHYEPGLGIWDLQGFQDRYPLNSRVVRDGPRLAEQPYRAGGGGEPPGLGARELASAVAGIEAALPYAPPEEREPLEKLAAFLRTGNDALFDEHDVLWVRHSFPVDYILGFIEQYSDPRQVKGLWEGMVAVRDPARDPPLKRLAGLAAFFEERMPWDARWRRSPEEVRPPTASAVQVVAAAGDALGFTFAGVNLPNKDSLRERHGSKDWVAVSVTDARERVRGDRVVREFVLPEVANEAARCWRAVQFAHVAYHELLGHASGRQDPALRGDPQRLLAPYYSTLEEARADLVAGYLLEDARTVASGMLPDAGCQTVAAQLEAMHFLTMLAAVPQGDLAEEDHLRAALVVQGWQTERGALRILERGPSRYAQVTDRGRWRDGMAALLQVLQTAKSTGDRKPIEDLVDRYGTRIDPSLRDEVVARMRRLGLPARIATLPPVLEPVRDAGGAVVDATARPARGVDDLIEAFARARGAGAP